MERDQRINELKGQLRSSSDNPHEFELKIIERDQRIDELENQLRSLSDKAHELELEIIGRDQCINELNDLLRSSNEWVHELKCTIADMQRSVLWQLLDKYQIGFVDRALPHGTGGREKYDSALKCARILFDEGLSSFFKSSINFRGTQRRFNSEPSENETSSSQERIERSEEKAPVQHQEEPLGSLPIEAYIKLKKGNNLINFYIPEGCEMPCDIPEMKREVSRCLSQEIGDISIMEGIVKLPLNWHWIEGSNESTLCWLSNGAIMAEDPIADCNAKLVLKAWSSYRPGTLEISTKNEQTRCNFKKCDGKKYVPLKSVEIKADKNALKNELDNILERMNSKI
jgi:hypothetical protein